MVSRLDVLCKAARIRMRDVRWALVPRPLGDADVRLPRLALHRSNCSLFPSYDSGFLPALSCCFASWLYSVSFLGFFCCCFLPFWDLRCSQWCGLHLGRFIINLSHVLLQTVGHLSWEFSSRFIDLVSYCPNFIFHFFVEQFCFIFFPAFYWLLALNFPLRMNTLLFTLQSLCQRGYYITQTVGRHWKRRA